VWKGKVFHASRKAGRIQEVFNGKRERPFEHRGKLCHFPYSFVLCSIPPKPTMHLGTIDADSPLAMLFPIRIKGHNVTALFDSGASHSFIKESVLQTLGSSYKPSKVSITLADGSVSLTKGEVDLTMKFTPHVSSRHTLIVTKEMLEGVDVIIGQDWMHAHKTTIDFSRKAAQFFHCGK
jgi:Aspartyl protease